MFYLGISFARIYTEHLGGESLLLQVMQSTLHRLYSRTSHLKLVLSLLLCLRKFPCSLRLLALLVSSPLRIVTRCFSVRLFLSRVQLFLRRCGVCQVFLQTVNLRRIPLVCRSVSFAHHGDNGVLNRLLEFRSLAQSLVKRSDIHTKLQSAHTHTLALANAQSHRSIQARHLRRIRCYASLFCLRLSACFVFRILRCLIVCLPLSLLQLHIPLGIVRECLQVTLPFLLRRLMLVRYLLVYSPLNLNRLTPLSPIRALRHCCLRHLHEYVRDKVSHLRCVRQHCRIQLRCVKTCHNFVKLRDAAAKHTRHKALPCSLSHKVTEACQLLRHTRKIRLHLRCTTAEQRKRIILFKRSHEGLHILLRHIKQLLEAAKYVAVIHATALEKTCHLRPKPFQRLLGVVQTLRVHVRVKRLGIVKLLFLTDDVLKQLYIVKGIRYLRSPL